MSDALRVFFWLSGSGILTSQDITDLSDGRIQPSDAGYYLRKLVEQGKAVRLVQRARWGLIRYAFVKGSTPPAERASATSTENPQAAGQPARILFCPVCGYLIGERCARYGCKTMDDVPSVSEAADAVDIHPDDLLHVPTDREPASPRPSVDLPAMLCTGIGRPKPARANHPRAYLSTPIERVFGSFPRLRGDVATQKPKGK